MIGTTTAGVSMMATGSKQVWSVGWVLSPADANSPDNPVFRTPNFRPYETLSGATRPGEFARRDDQAPRSS